MALDVAALGFPLRHLVLERLHPGLALLRQAHFHLFYLAFKGKPLLLHLVVAAVAAHLLLDVLEGGFHARRKGLVLLVLEGGEQGLFLFLGQELFHVRDLFFQLVLLFFYSPGLIGAGIPGGLRKIGREGSLPERRELGRARGQRGPACL